MITYLLFVFSNADEYVSIDPSTHDPVMNREAFCKAQAFPGVKRLLAEMKEAQMLEQFGTSEYLRRNKVCVGVCVCVCADANAHGVCPWHLVHTSRP